MGDWDGLKAELKDEINFHLDTRTNKVPESIVDQVLDHPSTRALFAAAMQAEREAFSEQIEMQTGRTDVMPSTMLVGLAMWLKRRGDTSALAAALAKARAEGMEAAAKWHDAQAAQIRTRQLNPSSFCAAEEMHIDSAAEIRAQNKGDGAS